MAEFVPLLQLCAYGCRLGVKLSCELGLNTALETFVNTLSQFATLRRLPTIVIIPQNVICLQALLAICETDGDKLKRSWHPILQCMAQFARLRVLTNSPSGGGGGGGGGTEVVSENSSSTRNRYSTVELDSSTDSEEKRLDSKLSQTRSSSIHCDSKCSPQHLSSRESSRDSNKMSITSEEVGSDCNQPSAAGSAAATTNAEQSFFQSFQKEIRIQNESRHRDIVSNPLLIPAATESGMKLSSSADNIIGLQLLSEIDWLDIEKVFTDSEHLSCDSLRYLVDGLIVVGNGEDPIDKAYSLRWLVHVADINMDLRSRLEWQPLWAAIGGYLKYLGSQGGQADISILAMSYLQQLAIKFLAKPELWDFHFQRDFLGPFEAAMVGNPEVSVREFVLRCVEQVIIFEASFLRSGWVTIFSVLANASYDSSGHITDVAYRILDYLVQNCLDLVVETYFSSLVVCIILFTRSESLDVALGSIKHLKLCCEELLSGAVDSLKQRHPPPAMISPNSSSSFIPTYLPPAPHHPKSNSAVGDQVLRNVHQAALGPEMGATELQFSRSENALLANPPAAGAGVKEQEDKDEISPKAHDDPLLQHWWCILEGLARCV